MSENPERPLKEMREIAEAAVAELAPHCERIEIAGSIRRNRPMVSDIEIVCIPKLTPGEIQEDLFGPITDRPMEDAVRNYLVREVWEGPSGGSQYELVEPWGVIQPRRFGSKYKALYYGDTPLDLFMVTPPAQWGVILAIRTGPAALSKALVTPKKWGGLLPDDAKVEKGTVWVGSVPGVFPEEEDFLNFLGLHSLPPEMREDFKP